MNIMQAARITVEADQTLRVVRGNPIVNDGVLILKPGDEAVVEQKRDHFFAASTLYACNDQGMHIIILPPPVTEMTDRGEWEELFAQRQHASGWTQYAIDYVREVNPLVTLRPWFADLCRQLKTKPLVAFARRTLSRAA